MTGLRIAPDLALPIDLVTEPIGVLANRGRGKSYATHALVEEIHDAGVPVVILDIKGDWWGVRSSADGTSEGMPFYIFGGDHADLPLEATAGELLADLVVDERVSVVLDLSLLSKTKARSFTTAFAERLYHRNREPIFLVVDEADVLIPQRQAAETARLIGAMEDLAKRGRGRGIGMAVVTQRPQEVAKSVLDLMETLLLMGMTGRLALKSVGEWTNIHVDDDDPAAVMRELPRMQVGEAWVWSPLHGILQRIRVRPLRTFDSHPTPKAGETRRAPKARTVLDLAALGTRISETVERAKADDPKALRARIRDLEQELATAIADRPEPVEVTVEVPVLMPEIVDQLEALLEPAVALLGETQETLLKHRMWAERQLEEARTPRPTQSSLPNRPTATAGSPRPAPRAPAATTARAATTPAGQGTTTDDVQLRTGPSKPQHKILNALAWFEAVGITAPTRGQVAFQARVSPKSSGFDKNCSTLRTRGMIDYPSGNRLCLTDEGRSVAEWPERPGTSLDLQQAFYEGVSNPQAAILQVLVDLYPGDVDRQTLADAVDVSAASSGFDKNLSTLRSLGLVDYPSPGLVVATDMLFLDGA